MEKANGKGRKYLTGDQVKNAVFTTKVSLSGGGQPNGS